MCNNNAAASRTCGRRPSPHVLIVLAVVALVSSSFLPQIVEAASPDSKKAQEGKVLVAPLYLTDSIYRTIGFAQR
eukprot:7177910-Pyramimonas_sp.AAC.1